jgi:peptidoglycan/LPS O-acetylase OafA/YrhL
MGNLESVYRPHVDGLRAIAVVLVVIYHAFPAQLPGGFVGVDIFFVISGYLITGNIARDLGQGRFDLLDFYARRVRRIFPALLVVLVATLILGYLFMLPAAYRQLGIDTFASAAFSANFALMLQSGYFDLESTKKPLLHLWSLGIEEQFYLFWPLIVLICARRGSSLFRVSVAIGAASFALNLALVSTHPVATFYLPFTRAFELLAGAALPVGWRPSYDRRWHDIRALAGVFLLGAAAALFNSAAPFPGWRAALPVAGAILLLSAPGAWGCRTILSSPVFVRIGLISYPLYLWHWPLLVYFALIKFNPLTDLERGLTIGLSLLLAWATYCLVEVPVRFGRMPVVRAGGLAAGMAVVAAAGILVVRGEGFDFRLPPQIRAIAAVTTGTAAWRVDECLLNLSIATTYAETCVDRGRHPMIFLWGDSTAGALMPGLRRAQEVRNFGVAQFTANSCMPTLDGPPPCREHNESVLEIAVRLDPEIVLLHAYWGVELDGIAELVRSLKRRTHARVVVLGPVPVWRRGLPNEVLRYYLLHHELIPEKSGGAVSSNWQDDEIRRKVEPLGAEFVSAWEALCDAQGCLARTGPRASDLAYSDSVHLMESASILLVGSIIERLIGDEAIAEIDR